MERRWCQLRSCIADIKINNGPLATVLELCDEAWMHTILSEHPFFWPQKQGL
jgi:hypothetical protein